MARLCQSRSIGRCVGDKLVRKHFLRLVENFKWKNFQNIEYQQQIAVLKQHITQLQGTEYHQQIAVLQQENTEHQQQIVVLQQEDTEHQQQIVVLSGAADRSAPAIRDY